MARIGEKYGFIDQTGRWVIQPQFDSAGNFVEGLAYVRVTENSADSYIDKEGRAIELSGQYRQIQEQAIEDSQRKQAQRRQEEEATEAKRKTESCQGLYAGKVLKLKTWLPGLKATWKVLGVSPETGKVSIQNLENHFYQEVNCADIN